MFSVSSTSKKTARASRPISHKTTVTLVSALDRSHKWASTQPVLLAAAAFFRILLAAGFIPPGLQKVVGHRFTSLGVDTPVGYFFDAFFQAGPTTSLSAQPKSLRDFYF